MWRTGRRGRIALGHRMNDDDAVSSRRSSVEEGAERDDASLFITIQSESSAIRSTFVLRVALTLDTNNG